MQIKGKTAFVTGGASGLGAATVKRLHGMGANIVVADMNKDTGEAMIKELGSRAIFVQMDITNPDQVKAGFDRALKEFKNVHILVHCAGTGWVGKIAGKEGPHDLNMFIKIVNINLVGTHGTIRNNLIYSKKKYPGQTGWTNVPTILPDSGDVRHHPFTLEAMHLLDCILSNKESHVSVADAYKTHEACFAADLSGQEGRPVALPLA